MIVNYSVDSIFDNVLPKNTEGFQIRQGQKKLSLAIEKAMLHKELLAVEAGTGTGKSFAYLVPALLQAHKGSQIVIVTATIALQHQLADKDIPHLQNVLGTDISVCVLKGRTNYVCGSRFQKFIEGEDGLLFGKEEHGGEEFITKLSRWVSGTTTGDRENFQQEMDIEVGHKTNTFIPQKVWKNICTHDFSCGGIECSNRGMRGCFFSTVRRQALKSGIIITNYNVLSYYLQQLQDGDGMLDGGGLLPHDATFVLDEAHKMKQIVRDSMAVDLSQVAVQNMYDFLFSGRGIIEVERKTHGEFDTTITDQIKKFRTTIQKFNKQLETPNEHLSINTKDNKYTKKNTGHKRYEECVSDVLVDIFYGLFEDIVDIVNTLKNIIKMIGENSGLTMQLQKVVVWWEERALVCKQFSSDKDFVDAREKQVRFVSYKTNESNDKKEYTYSIIPFSVNSFLANNFFNLDSAIIALSATMTSEKRFQYWSRQVGFPAGANTLLIESPFDYKKNVQLIIPHDAPAPTEEDVYIHYLIQTLPALIDVSKGRALVLCTSKYMVGVLADGLILHKKNHKTNWEVLCQDGQMSTTALSQIFRKHQNAVLVGTASFWEGFDAPDDMLRLLIITRLPFSSPEDLLFKEEKLYLEQKNINWFLKLALPIAEIKLRQGVGRLMRSEDDGGVVIITDSRIITKRYGKTLLQQLPPCTVQILASNQMSDCVKKHLGMFDV